MPIKLYDNQGSVDIANPQDAEAHIVAGRGDFLPDQEVYIKDIDKGLMKITGAEASNLIRTGAPGVTLASDEDVFKGIREKRYEGPVQKGIAATQGVVNSAGLGFGDALAGAAIDLVTPRDSTLRDKYTKGAKERAEVYPGYRLGGDIVGAVADPLGTFSALSGGTKAITKPLVKAAITKAETLAPEVISKALKTPIVQKSIERAIRYGSEGSIIAGSAEAGREIRDNDPLNAEAILSEAGTGLKFGAAAGPAVTVAEQAGLKAFGAIKNQTKKYIDKLTSSGESAAEEIHGEVPKMAIKKEKESFSGRNQESIKGTERPGPSPESPPEIIYKKGNKEIKIEIDPTAQGLDLGNAESVDQLGEKVGVKDLGDKYRWGKKEGQTIQEFLLQEKNAQRISDDINNISPFMNEADQATLETINKLKEKLKSLPEKTPEGENAYSAIKREEQRLLEKQSMKPIKNQVLNAERDAVATKRALSEYDYIKNTLEDGEAEYHIYNENVLPDTLQSIEYPKGKIPVSYEAGQMAKQFKMSLSQMKMKGRGNSRLNDVASFIFDQYPKSGNFLKRGMTGIDTIIENVSNVKNKAISDIDESITQALNSGTKQKLTTDDVARYIENEILPHFTDPKTGNPMAGLAKESNEISKFAKEFRENGYTLDKYGKKSFKPMTVEEIRDLRIRLDKLARFDKDTLTVMQEAARDVRTHLENQVMSRVGEQGNQLREKYQNAKIQYGLARDAEQIIEAAAKKASKGSKFSLFYSGVGAATGASVAGAPGAIVGGLAGGALSNAMKEYSGAVSALIARDLGQNIERYENSINKAARSFIKPLETVKNAYIRSPKSTDYETAKKDYNRLAEEVSNKEQYLESFMDENQHMFQSYPQTSRKMVEAISRGREFLISKIPKNPYSGNPLKEHSWAPSNYEMDKYMRYREAVQSPKVILGQFRDGYLTPEASEVLSLVYPDTKDALRNSLIEEISKIKEIPVNKRVEIYKVFGIQLDSFMTGKNFIDLQKDSNAQAQNSAMSNGQQSYKPQNAMKTNIGKKDSTLGNSTLK